MLYVLCQIYGVYKNKHKHLCMYIYLFVTYLVVFIADSFTVLLNIDVFHSAQPVHIVVFLFCQRDCCTQVIFTGNVILNLSIVYSFFHCRLHHMFFLIEKIKKVNCLINITVWFPSIPRNKVHNLVRQTLVIRNLLIFLQHTFRLAVNTEKWPQIG